MMRRDVFQAIADPVRRQIINVIASGTYTLNTVAENFEISRPAISKHIKILTECGLVTIRQKGRERYCEAKLDKLNEVSAWVEQYRIFWAKKLDDLGLFLQAEQPAPPVNRPVKKMANEAVKKKAGNKTAGSKIAKNKTS
jgi:DNA-binding transcriptional ArsR family regulator